MARKRFLFLGNSTYTNHGSEAIVRGTAAILREYFDHPEFISAETKPYYYSDLPETDPDITHKPVILPKPYSVPWFFNQTRKVLLTRPVAYQYFVRKLRPEIKRADAVLSLGGDGYRERPFLQIAENDLAVKSRIPVILWGASVGPITGSQRYQKSVFNHLGRLNAIFVRETLSHAYLADHGVQDNVYLVDDPAFVMEPEMPRDLEFAAHLPHDAIGVSLSGLYLHQTRFSDNPGRAVYDIVQALRKRFGRPIILIPHCVDYRRDDHALLNSVLTENASAWPDVVCLPKLWYAAEIKWAISRLYALVGARAHATIAAFSTCVPTVSLVYSNKGAGFNQRLFQSLDYVVKKNECRPEMIVEKLELVIKNRDVIRRILQDKMVEVKAGAMRAGHLLKTML